MLDATPIAGLKKRAVEGSKDRTLSDAEIKVLWPALATGNGMLDDVALALKALLLAGQRPGEIVGARQSESCPPMELTELESRITRKRIGRPNVPAATRFQGQRCGAGI